MKDDRGVWVLVASAIALVMGLGLPASVNGTGLIEADGRTFRDVIASCFGRPFQTDADMRIYHTNTKGHVATDGEPVFFSYPGIQDVLVNGEPLPVVQRGPNLIQVRMAAGVHDVEVVALDTPIVFDLPEGLEHETPPVSDIDAFNEQAEALRPGDELIIKNGVYTGWATALVEGKGTAGKPVIIRPETPGGVIFRGRTHIRLTGRHIVFKGFRFDHAGPAHVLYLIEGEHIRITQCQFTSCGDAGRTFSHIVRITRNCHRSRVDHCYFTTSKSISVGLRIIGADDLPTHNRIDHNIFRDIFRSLLSQRLSLDSL